MFTPPEDHPFVKVATCNLNQWAMDFEGNKRRVIQSLVEAKRAGATLRVGPELELSGYSCEDHFLEIDTVDHCWEVLGQIIEEGYTKDLLSTFGMPVLHRGVLYNCIVVVNFYEVLLIRPKMAISDEGNYREGRFFTPWLKEDLEEFSLPRNIRKITGKETAMFGFGIIKTLDTELGFEFGAELLLPSSISEKLGLEGVEICANSWASHYECNYTEKRIELLKDATKKNGGCYIFANQRGNDGARLYFDGTSAIFVNGEVVKIASQFGLKDVEVITANINLQDIRTMRIGKRSRALQSQKEPKIPRIQLNFRLSSAEEITDIPQSISISNFTLPMQEEIGQVPACYLWDYLRRSGASGYALALSGGADSCTVAMFLYTLACKLIKEIKEEKSISVLSDLRKVTRDPEFSPETPREIMNRILFTVYMSSENSSAESQARALEIAKSIGSYHLDIDMRGIVDAFIDSIHPVFEKKPEFQSNGGTIHEDTALQNLQARTRLALGYMIAQLIPSNITKKGFILTLSTMNLDEGISGYHTKYDNSSADINPLGGLSKVDIREFLKWCRSHYEFKIIDDVLNTPPTAELKPLDPKGKIQQTDESEIGFTYEELNTFAKLRKLLRHGPYTMFSHLAGVWKSIPVTEIANKVKKFFVGYSKNRHKATILTPSLHMQPFSIDDNRNDLRPFVYNNNWDHQFKSIDRKLLDLKK